MDYPNLWGFLRDVYNYEGIGEATVDLEYCKVSYMVSPCVMCFIILIKILIHNLVHLLSLEEIY